MRIGASGATVTCAGVATIATVVDGTTDSRVAGAPTAPAVPVAPPQATAAIVVPSTATRT